MTLKNHAIVIAIASLTGNTKTFVDFIKSNYPEQDFVVCEDFSEDLSSYDRIILGSYSWGGSGKIPAKMKKYIIRNKDNFRNKDVLVFGSGNSVYPHFCGAVDGMKTIVDDCGGNIIGDIKFEQRFNEDYIMESDPTQLIQIKSLLNKFIKR